MRVGRGIGGIASVCLLGAATLAAAEPRDAVTNGVEAALTDGTVVATAESGAGIWYNPATLVSVESGAFDISGSVYTMRVGSAGDFLRVESGADGSGSQLDFTVVPRAFSFATNLRPDVVFAAGLFHSVLGANSLRSSVQTEAGSTSWAVSHEIEGSALHAAFAAAWELRSDLSLGWALDLVYARASVVNVVGSETTEAAMGAPAPYSMADHTDWYAFGPQARFGVRWVPSSRYRLGLTLGSPTLAVFRGIQRLKTHGGPGDGRELTAGAPGVVDDAEGTADMLEPGRVRIGLARTWPGGWVALDHDLRFPLRSELRFDSDWGNTLRLGALHRVRPRARVGGAVFAQIEREVDDHDLGGETLDYYGANFGVDISNRAIEAFQRTRVSIALALNYAYGVGTRTGVLAPADPTASAPTLVQRPLHVHEISLNLALRASR